MANDEIYLAVNEELDPIDYLFAYYRVESDLDLLQAGIRIAQEQSIGTWTDVYTTDYSSLKDLAALVNHVDKDHKMIKIAFPVEIFDLNTGGLPGFLSVVAGNLFGLGTIKKVRLEDIEIPEKIARAFPGPKFGIEGIRRIVGTTESKRPHMGTIIKPKVGLNPEQTAHVAYEAAIGGVDLIKDDETLTDQSFCRLRDRVPKVLDMLDKVKDETGRTVLYATNITAPPDKLLENLDFVQESGGNMVMIDVLTAGFGTLEMLRKEPSLKVPIHVHRTMHAAITKLRDHGINFKVFAKLVRMAGGDQLHSGTAAGKMGEHDAEEIREVQEIYEFLRSDFYGLKKVFPVASGGVYPGIVGVNIKYLGRDIILQAGGGIHGHPKGTRAGAMAMRQAIDAAINGIPVEEYAKTHEELKLALEKWGHL